MGEIGKKYCNHCDTTKPIAEFGKNRYRPDGYQHWCKACRKAEYDRKYAAKARQYGREAYQANREARIAHVMAYTVANREKVRAYKRQYAKDNAKRLAEKTAAWREENVGHMVAWREANPDHSRRNHAARKARHNALPYERVDLDAVRERSEGLCWLCRGELGDDATADHLIPLAAHPDDLAVWAIEHPGHVTANLDMAHRKCNTSKHKRLMVCAIARYLRNVEQDAATQGPCRSAPTRSRRC